MSTKLSPTSVHTLNTQSRSAIVAAFCNAFDTTENTGSLVTQVCDVARRQLKGAVIQKSDMDEVVNDLARARNWKDKTLTARSSEVRVILRAYQTLGEAVSKFAAKAKKCDWHTSMKLARRINSGDSVSQAVTNAFTQAASKPISYEGRTAGALKAWFENSRGDKRQAILKAAELLHLELRVKI